MICNLQQGPSKNKVMAFLFYGPAIKGDRNHQLYDDIYIIKHIYIFLSALLLSIFSTKRKPVVIKYSLINKFYIFDF
jgi:hypothetical protein